MENDIVKAINNLSLVISIIGLGIIIAITNI